MTYESNAGANAPERNGGQREAAAAPRTRDWQSVAAAHERRHAPRGNVTR